MKHSDIRFLKFMNLRGPNIWTYRPVLEAWVDIGELEECPSNTIPGFVDRLCAWLPTLAEHRCSYGEPGGFVRRLQDGTWPAHILEHVTLELQNLAGLPGGFGKARETSIRGVYKVAVSAWHETSTRTCMEAARELVLAAIRDVDFDLDATMVRLRETARLHLPDASTMTIINAATAKDRRIPMIRLPGDNLVQLGYGSSQRRIWGTKTDRTGAIAEGISLRPELSRSLLESCCLPVAASEGEESAQTGKAHRLLVVDGNLVAAACIDSCVDVTDEVHPAISAAACLATRVLGLDIAGVDVTAREISQALVGQGGMITAVHASPGLEMHLNPASGAARPIGRAIVDHLFPNGDSGRIPVVGISGSSGMCEVAQLVAEFLRLGGKFTGLACGDGFFLGRRQVEAGDCANWRSGTRVLMNRSLEAAVLESSGDVILSEGLAYDRCQIGVLTRIDTASHYGRYHIEKPEQVFQIMRTQVDVVLPEGVAVLNGADPMVMEMVPFCDGEVILFAIDPDLPSMSEHRSKGGRTAFLRGNELCIASPEEESSLALLSQVPFLGVTGSPERLENVLAAIGAAWALGIALHVISTGLQTFSPESVNPVNE